MGPSGTLSSYYGEYGLDNLQITITYTTAAGGPSGLKTMTTIAAASLKTIEGTAIASVKTVLGVS